MMLPQIILRGPPLEADLLSDQPLPSLLLSINSEGPVTLAAWISIYWPFWPVFIIIILFFSYFPSMFLCIPFSVPNLLSNFNFFSQIGNPFFVKIPTGNPGTHDPGGGQIQIGDDVLSFWARARSQVRPNVFRPDFKTEDPTAAPVAAVGGGYPDMKKRFRKANKSERQGNRG